MRFTGVTVLVGCSGPANTVFWLGACSGLAHIKRLTYLQADQLPEVRPVEGLRDLVFLTT
jgi:hypothetical protein